MPFFVERDTPVGIASGDAQLPVDFTQTGQAVGRNLARKLEGQSLQGREDRAGFPHLDSIQTADAESPSHVRFEGSLPHQPEEGLAYRSSADAELGGNLGVPDTGARGELTFVDTVADLAVDLISQRCSGDNMSDPP